LIALDENGRPITDLKSDELHLFEGKVEQSIQTLLPAGNEPLTIGLFFDVSGSRRADAHVEEETSRSSEFLKAIWHEGDAALLVAFNDRQFLVVPPTQKLEEMEEGLKLIPGENRASTALYDALCLVKPYKLAGVSGRKIYVIFSDFGDNASWNKAERVLEVAHENEISLFPVLLSEGFGGVPDKRMEKRGRQIAQSFAEETGGELLIPDSGKQLASTFAQLANCLNAAYRVTYAPSAPNSEAKKKKKIRLETSRPNVKLIYPRS
jgi:VWFA-related protein